MKLLIVTLLVLLSSCIDIPKPEVTVEMGVPDYLEACLNEGYTQEQCVTFLCMQISPQPEAPEMQIDGAQ